MRNRVFIALSGVDGSGKTTQIELLEKRLKESGRDPAIVWCRWRPILSLPFLAVLKRLGLARVHATSSIGFVETEVSGTSRLASLWSLLVSLDNFLKNGVKVLVPIIMGRSVICDRYVLDLLVEDMAGLHDSPDRSRLGRRLLKLLPRPDQSFLIEIAPDVAFRRKPDMPTLGHFEERVRLYHDLGVRTGVRIIDGKQSPSSIHGEIWKQVSGIVS